MVSARRERIEVRLAQSVGAKLQREVGGFVRYCVRRIESELGEREQWIVTIAVSQLGYKTQVVLEHYGLTLDASGSGHEPTLSVWDAMCKVEQALRERRGSVAPLPREREAERKS